MAMRVEPQKIPKRLDRNHRSRHPIPLWTRLLGKHPQIFQSTTTQFRKKRTIVEEIASKDLGNAEDKVSSGLAEFTGKGISFPRGPLERVDPIASSLRSNSLSLVKSQPRPIPLISEIDIPKSELPNDLSLRREFNDLC
jgi:hypothetical protein